MSLRRVLARTVLFILKGLTVSYHFHNSVFILPSLETIQSEIWQACRALIILFLSLRVYLVRKKTRISGTSIIYLVF